MQRMSTTPYPRAEWRLIVDPEPRTGAWNMALDEAILDAVAAGQVLPTVRFYQWNPPSLSLGKRQPLDGVDVARCRADGVDVVRRPTGGLAILHTDEWTYSVVAPQDDPRTVGPMLDAYRRLSAALVAGLERLGAHAEMHPVNPLGAQNLSAACFEVPSAYEITVGGMKLMGSAQTRPSGRMLQHGSLPLHGDIARVAEYLWYDTDADRQRLRAHLEQRATTLRDALGRPVTFAATCAAMHEGFAQALNLALVSAGPTAREVAAAASRVPSVLVTETPVRT
jgi:lipoyl(octanoyl) transferase